MPEQSGRRMLRTVPPQPEQSLPARPTMPAKTQLAPQVPPRQGQPEFDSKRPVKTQLAPQVPARTLAK